MLTDDPRAFAAALPPGGSLLALDVSKRRIGFAGTDPGRRLVTPLHSLARRLWQDDLTRIRQLIRDRGVVGLVLGLPLNMDGTAGPRAQSVRDTSRLLVEGTALPILLQDERLSTFAVQNAIEEGRLPRPKKDQPLDHYAAAVILEDALRATAG